MHGQLEVILVGIIATIVLVASFAMPAAIPSPPVEWSAKLVLMAMHVVGYAVILGTLWLGHQRGWLTKPLIDTIR